MPIECAEEIRAATREEFYQVDKRMVGIAFEVHNDFGRFLDEDLYQTEIAARCRDRGLYVTREMRIRLTHETFVKESFVDLMINRGVVVELKTVDALHPGHHAQVINYLLLTKCHHGSLINLRPRSVKRRFVSTSLTLDDRRCFRLCDRDWTPLAPEFCQLRERMTSLLCDWGAFLDFRMYRDAITHFLGGTDNAVRKLPVYSGSNVIGNQEVRLLTDEFAFALSAVKENRDEMLKHQQRFLRHTDLSAIAWINLNGHDIEFTTIRKDSVGTG